MEILQERHVFVAIVFPNTLTQSIKKKKILWTRLNPTPPPSQLRTIFQEFNMLFSLASLQMQRITVFK